MGEDWMRGTVADVNDIDGNDDCDGDEVNDNRFVAV